MMFCGTLWECVTHSISANNHFNYSSGDMRNAELEFKKKGHIKNALKDIML